MPGRLAAAACSAHVPVGARELGERGGGGAARSLLRLREVVCWGAGCWGPLARGVRFVSWGWRGSGLAPSGRRDPQEGWAASRPGRRWRRELRGSLAVLPRLPSPSPGVRVLGARRSSWDRWAREAGGRALPEGGLGGRGAAARAEKLRPRRGGAEGEPRGASACYSGAPESCRGWRQGRRERFGVGRRTSCCAVELSE